MRRARIVIIAIASLFGLIWLMNDAFFQRGDCLDNGGRWDEDTGSCQLE